jgi:hypothetical protein
MFRLFAGDGGAIFDGTVQTPLVRAGSGKELRSVFATDSEYLNRCLVLPSGKIRRVRVFRFFSLRAVQFVVFGVVIRNVIAGEYRLRRIMLLLCSGRGFRMVV